MVLFLGSVRLYRLAIEEGATTRGGGHRHPSRRSGALARRNCLPCLRYGRNHRGPATDDRGCLTVIVYVALPAIAVIGGVAGLFWFVTGKIVWAGSKPSPSWRLLVFVFFLIGFGATFIWIGNEAVLSVLHR